MDIRNKAVFADDLTGAMDAGVAVLSKGLSVNVVFDYQNISSLSPQGLVIFAMQSRNIPEKMAYARIVENIVSIRNLGLKLVYKKVDSTLRENLGSELAAILDMNPRLMIAFAPALPYNGRQTKHGSQYVNGLPLTKSDISKDPFSTVRKSNISKILAEQTDYKSGVIDIVCVRQGQSCIAQKLREFKEQGIRIAIFDVMEDSDFETIVSGMNASELPLLPCGSAGLFPYIFGNDEAAGFKRRKLYRNDRPALIISGSPAIATKRQIQTAVHEGIPYVKLNIRKIISDETDYLQEYKRVVSQVMGLLAAKQSVIIDGAGDSKSAILKQNREDAVKILRDGITIQNCLSNVASEAVGNQMVSGIFVAGGDTAMSIFRKLGAFGVRITNELEPYVPSGRLLGGKYHGIPIITKAGGFGSEAVMVKSISHLKGEL